MSSNGNAEPDVDFERDVPTTKADVDALERARQMRALPTAVYLEWLSRMPKTLLRKPDEPLFPDEPFEL
jgi:hypothetical protein